MEKEGKKPGRGGGPAVTRRVGCVTGKEERVVLRL